MRVCLIVVWVLAHLLVALPHVSAKAIAVYRVSSLAGFVDVHNFPVKTPASLRLDKNLQIGGEDSPDSPLLVRISDIAVDDDGCIYVADRKLHHVLVYDRQGEFLRQIGREGEGPGEFRCPVAIAFDDDGNMYVADQQNVSIFARSKEFVSRFNYHIPGGYVWGMAVSAQKHVILSCFEIFDQQIIHKYDKDGEMIASFCDSYAVGTGEDIRIESTYAGGPIDIDAQGRICFSQLTPYEIRKFSNDGELLTVVYRDNDFMHKPVVKKHGDYMEFFMATGSYGFAVLRDGGMVNSVIVAKDRREGRAPSLIDIFAADGALVGTIEMDPSSLLKCADEKDQLYFVEFGEQQTIVRYSLVR